MPEMLLTMGAVMLLMWFVMIRPAQRKLREQVQTQSAIGEGQRVLLTSGIFGTVKHAGTTQVVLEIAPEVDVTVMRRAISRVVTADEEEFEFVDPVTPDEELDATAVYDAYPAGDTQGLGSTAALAPADETQTYDPSAWSRQQEAAFGRPADALLDDVTAAGDLRPTLDENKDK